MHKKKKKKNPPGNKKAKLTLEQKVASQDILAVEKMSV